MQVSRSLAACEGCLLVVDAAQGVEAQTLANVYLAMENELEIIVVLNKVDLPGARWAACSQECRGQGAAQPATEQIGQRTCRHQDRQRIHLQLQAAASADLLAGVLHAISVRSSCTEYSGADQSHMFTHCLECALDFLTLDTPDQWFSFSFNVFKRQNLLPSNCLLPCQLLWPGLTCWRRSLVGALDVKRRPRLLAGHQALRQQ